MAPPCPQGARSGEEGGIVVRFPVVPPAELSMNARRRGKVWEQREATDALHWACLVHLKTNHPGVAFTRRTPVTLDIEVRWPVGRRRYDVDSLASLTKAAVDSLVAFGVLAGGDGPDAVTAITYRQSKAPKGEDGMTVVTIRPTGGQG